MEPTRPKPTRKRRRRLIVAFVLVSLLSWWNWPRGDARFVGKWELSMWFSQRNPSAFQFLANGRGRLSSQPSVYSTAEPSERAFRWWVSGDSLYLEWHDDQGLKGLYQRLQSAVAPHIGLVPSLRPERRRIHEVQPNQITIDNTAETRLGGWESRTVLIRIRE